MILKSELRKIVEAQQQELDKNLGITREMNINLIPKFATIISGIRRCGKSTLARQVLKDHQPVYFLNFEDIRLAKFEPEDFLRLREVFQSILPSDGVFFFDEIQLINKWEQYIRQLVDENNKVLITGSNASMLSRELGTRLTGRHISKQLYPFSYKEFLSLKGDGHNIANFQAFLKDGGFPEYLKVGETDILKNLFQDIYYRDVIQRNDLRNEVAVKSLLSYLISNIGKVTSYNKLKTIAEVGSGNTISQLMLHFENAYLMFSVSKWDYSVKKQMANPKKIYCIDNGIITINSFSFSENRGRLLENSVFIELKRRNLEIYYFKEKGECDFVIKHGNSIVQAIQVCYEVDSENQSREINGLTEALKKLDLESGLILTFDQEDEISTGEFKISILPVWKWMLEL